MLSKIIMLSEELRNRKLVDLYEKGILELGDEIPYKHSEESYVSPGERNGYKDQSFSSKDVKVRWQVIGIEEVEQEKCLKLIAKQPIYEFEEFVLKGAAGYVYGIEELNKISELFGRGRGALKGKSIAIEDVNQLLGVEVDENRRIIYQSGINENINEDVKFMQTAYLHDFKRSNANFPHLWWREPPKYPEQEFLPSGYLKNESVSCKETCTGYYYSIYKIKGKEKEKVILFYYVPHNLIWRKYRRYWLASPSQGIEEDSKDFVIKHIGFGIRSLREEFFGSRRNLFLSDGRQYASANFLRPIIYLKPEATYNTFLEKSVKSLLREAEVKRKEEEDLIKKVEELMSIILLNPEEEEGKEREELMEKLNHALMNIKV